MPRQRFALANESRFPGRAKAVINSPVRSPALVAAYGQTGPPYSSSVSPYVGMQAQPIRIDRSWLPRMHIRLYRRSGIAFRRSRAQTQISENHDQGEAEVVVFRKSPVSRITLAGAIHSHDNQRRGPLHRPGTIICRSVARLDVLANLFFQYR